VEVTAQQPQHALAFVEFNAQALGFLAGVRGEPRGGDDDPLGDVTLRDRANHLPDCGDVHLVVRGVPLSLKGDVTTDERRLAHRTQADASVRPGPGLADFVKFRDLPVNVFVILRDASW
jgi:hypothetical protein